MCFCYLVNKNNTNIICFVVLDDNNCTNMEHISRALCILCLDEEGGDRADCDADTNGILRAMHGAGTRYHSANRWFDKTVQVS